MHLRRRYLIATAKTACSDTAVVWADGLNTDTRISSLKCHLASSTKPPTLYFMSKCHSPYLDVSCLFSGQKAATFGVVEIQSLTFSPDIVPRQRSFWHNVHLYVCTIDLQPIDFSFFFRLLNRVEWMGVSGLLTDLPTALVCGLLDGSSSCQRSPHSSLCPWQPGSLVGRSYCGESHCRAAEVTRLRRRLRLSGRSWHHLNYDLRICACLPVASSIMTAVVWGLVAMVRVFTGLCLDVCVRESTSYTCTCDGTTQCESWLLCESPHCARPRATGLQCM